MIRLLVTDVDGVLTDGSLHYGPDGERDKRFHVHDGVAIKKALAAGIEVAVVTGRGGAAVKRRMAELGVTRIVEGCEQKLEAVAALCREISCELEHVAYVGDDEADSAAIRSVGFGCAVANARPAVRASAQWVTPSNGGQGALRDVVERILSDREVPFRVVVPARLAATRLPNKPLRLLGGEPLVVRTWQRATKAGAQEVIVAADDEKIVSAVEEAGGRAVLTGLHESGTDRIAEVAAREGWGPDEIVVNLQGDEPMGDPSHISVLANALARDCAAELATLAVPIASIEELNDPSCVKVVLDDRQRALYFSRSTIPWSADMATQVPETPQVLRHVGMYAYRASVLGRLAKEPRRPLEIAESLEQLRALSLGLKIRVEILPSDPGPGIDTEEDLARAEASWAKGLR